MKLYKLAFLIAAISMVAGTGIFCHVKRTPELWLLLSIFWMLVAIFVLLREKL